MPSDNLVLDHVRHEVDINGLNPDQGVLDAFAKSVTPPPSYTIAEWAEREYYLPTESAAEPGLINIGRTPYMYGILDAIDDPDTEYVSMMMAAQLAKTTVILALLGRTCATPGLGAPILCLMPTLDNAQMLSKERFAPMIKSSPKLSEAVIDDRSKGKSQTVLQKNFRNGAIVTFVGSNAAAALASRPVKYVVADEVDRFAMSAGEEGDPLTLADKRTSTFEGNGKKLIATSTPTLKGISKIENMVNDSDQRKYFVPCPHCEHSHTMEWSYISWENDDANTAVYRCPECKEAWSDEDRTVAIRKGKWFATAKGTPGHVGFIMNALYSPWVGNPKKLVKVYLEAKKDPMKMRTFVNTILGETYTTDDLKVDEKDLYERRAPIGLEPVPAKYLVLTAGVDVQQDRLELVILGHSEDKQTAILAYEKLYGDPNGPKVWADLDHYLQNNFQHELGETIRVTATAIDSGYLATEVYNFVNRHPWKNYYATKGTAGQNKLMFEKSKSKDKAHERLWMVGVDTCKEWVMASVANLDSTTPGYMHIPDLQLHTMDMLKQLLSEYRDIDVKGNRPVYKWVRKPQRRAEVLDCVCYGKAVFESILPNWEMIREELTTVQNPTEEENGWYSY